MGRQISLHVHVGWRSSIGEFKLQVAQLVLKNVNMILLKMIPGGGEVVVVVGGGGAAV